MSQVKENLNGDTLQWAPSSPLGFPPHRASEGAAGLDLRASRPITIPAQESRVVQTDIQIRVPEGTYGRIAPRSGLAKDYNIDTMAGVIDSDYRGAISVILFNHGRAEFAVERGDRIAQLICEKISNPTLQKCQSLSDTVRNTHGFGSTGRN